MTTVLLRRRSLRQPWHVTMLAMHVLLAACMAAPCGAEQYDWGSLAIGGGGYVTGIVIHPTAADRTYIRTDVGGAYRWDTPSGSWVQMLGWLGPADANLVGVDGIAIDPHLPDRVYAALGKSSSAGGGVYRSDDRGVTWQLLMSARFEGNGRDLRWAGECLGVDPLTSDVIYCGTRLAGLWRSLDGGATWAQVAGVPAGYTGTNPTGVRSVAFDPASAIAGHAARIYIGVPGSGIYLSSDGGASFAAMSGSPLSPMRLQVVAGRLYVTHGSGVAAFSAGVWSDLTPPSGVGMNYCALAVDPADGQKIVVSQRASSYFNPMYRSSDGGASWAQITTSAAPTRLHVEVPWWQQNRFSSATAGMAFDPLHPGQLFATDWFGIWRTPDAWAATMDWYTQEQGHEETVVLSLVAPSTGALVYTGMADNFGFSHQALGSYPMAKLYSAAEGLSIAVCEQSPSHLAVLGASSWAGANLTLATSSTGGASWTTRTLPAGVQLGRISCSATDPSRLVYVAGGGGVSYSGDAGATWRAASGAPSGAVGLSDIWNKDFAIAADSVDGATFYLFKAGRLYTSSDSGATWNARNAAALPGQAGFLNVVSRPGTTQEVWISLDGNGLWRTTDGGGTFTHLTALSTATLFSFGAPPAGSSIPAAYCYGACGGVLGLYRSLDLGVSWLRINDDAHQFPSGAKALAGDRQVFGRVYIGSGGCGVFYGQPQVVLATPPPVINAQPLSQTVMLGGVASFSVVATASGAVSYQWQRQGVAISGATAASYQTSATVAGDDGMSFTCVVSAGGVSVTSNIAILHVIIPSGGSSSAGTTSGTTGGVTGATTGTAGSATSAGSGTGTTTASGSGSGTTASTTAGASATGGSTASPTGASISDPSSAGGGGGGCGLGGGGALILGACLMLRRRR